MKSLSSVILALSLVSGSSAFAQKPSENPACASIVKSCEAAGFKPGDHKKTGKGLWVDCIGAIAKGKIVAGVTATEAEAKACSESAKEHRAEKKAAKSK